MDFVQIRALHVTCAVLSVSLFTLRGIWMMLDSPQLQDRWIRVLPHAIDTVFLGSGIVLATVVHQYPFVQGWLTAKVFGLIAYIVLGSIALKRGRTRPMRIAAFAAALGVFLYIVGVARARDPWSWLAGFWIALPN